VKIKMRYLKREVEEIEEAEEGEYMRMKTL